MPFAVTGEVKLRELATRLRLAGSEGKRLRSRMRKAIVSAATPIRDEARANALAIPAHGPKHTGLRADIAKATKIVVRASGRTALVRVETKPGSMPAGKQHLPSYMEGLERWRHPVFQTKGRPSPPWVSQAAHSYFYRAARAHIASARTNVEAAVKETAAEIEGR